jgi:iron complex outermembrane receptor protein
MSAMDANAIEKSFSRTIDEITGMSPNLVINPILGNGTVGVSIRGMQHAEVEKSFDPAVAIYQDGIYLSSTTGALLNVWDAERVEVLRGPQGTLFGRNTIGGLVHVIRSKPTGEIGGKIVATIAEDSQEDFKALLNLPEIGGVSLKLSAASSKGGAYIKNASRGTTDGENDLFMFTIDALWQPTDNFDLRVIYDNIDDDTPTRPVTALTPSGEAFGAFCGDNCAVGKESKALYTTYTTQEQFAELHTDAWTIHANWQFHENHKLAFVFGDRDTDELARSTALRQTSSGRTARSSKARPATSCDSNRTGTNACDPLSASFCGRAITRCSRTPASSTSSIPRALQTSPPPPSTNRTWTRWESSDRSIGTLPIV